PKRCSVLVACLALAGCGYSPVYGPGGSAEALRGQIAIDDPIDAEGFALVRQLERRLGLPGAPTYQLSASIAIDEDELGITQDQTITRYNVVGEVAYTLADVTTGEAVTSGTASSFTSYSATGTTVATLSAQRDARERLMVILADQITAELLATSSDWR
ncbi:MAG: LPS assembly lipoprotein LptE, partial [Pseudomonadota bacterium]